MNCVGGQAEILQSVDRRKYKMKLKNVLLVVRDMSRSIAFY